jgi:hypothetical protein
MKLGKKLVWSKGVKVVTPTPNPSPSPTPTISPIPSPSPTPSPSVKQIDPTKSVEGAPCSPISDSEDRVGYSKDFKQLVLLHCLVEGRFFDFGKQYPIVVNQLTGEVESGILYSNAALHNQIAVESTTSPNTLKLTESSNLSIENCKISQSDINGLHKGFNWQDYANFKALGPNTTIQVLPLQATDSLSNSDPSQDYKSFIDEVIAFTKNLSDGQWNLKFSVPHSYFMLPNSLESYKVGLADYNSDLRTPGQENLVRAGLAVANLPSPDSIGMYLIVTPLDTPDKLFVRFSNTFSIQIGSHSHVKAFAVTKNDPAWGTIHHDFFHLGLTIPDHYGDEIYNGKDSTQLIGNSGEILGTDRWGNLSGTKMDWLAWDKWLGGFLQDTQVICANIKQSSTFWIKPSSVYSVNSKLLVIPTGLNTGIAVESIRNVGLNSFLPKNFNGALVYSLDLTNPIYGAGINVIRPISRIADKSPFPLPGDDTLKQGESIIFKGYRIEVIEAGDFGDVIRVEKIS